MFSALGHMEMGQNCPGAFGEKGLLRIEWYLSSGIFTMSLCSENDGCFCFFFLRITFFLDNR